MLLVCEPGMLLNFPMMDKIARMTKNYIDPNIRVDNPDLMGHRAFC